MSEVIGLDTNILVRYYVGDATDVLTERQRSIARKLMDSGRPLAIAKTVMLELEWVLRGYYGFGGSEIRQVFAHLLTQPHIRIEDRRAVERAVSAHAAGLDFADALHHASYGDCKSVATFDDRRFARRSTRLGLSPSVTVPR
ncbi:MAG: type II toxin-antitoxin system VapC family toxin [Wenzhouxiangella sp.]